MLHALLVLAALAQPPQAATAKPAFEVATVKPVESQPKDSRILRVEGVNRFVAKNFTLKLLIAAAYDLNPKAISGGPAWLDSAKFDIAAVTPGETRPTRTEQMAMLRTLLAENFQLSFHREQKEFSIYALSVSKAGPRLKESGKTASDPSNVTSTVYPDHVLMPTRNASIGDFVAVLQRAILDRPVVDNTGLTGRYDFDLEWAPSEREFGGEIEVTPGDTSRPSLVTALQETLGLKLEATRGQALALVVDHAQKPATN